MQHIVNRNMDLHEQVWSELKSCILFPLGILQRLYMME
jgi:hypothetical protein